MEHLVEILILILLAIVFLQSGLDKVLDWKGNVGWLQSHFANSIVKNIVVPSLAFITVLELISGASALLGIFFLLTDETTDWARVSALISAITFLLLFFGQRLAKDYPGAQSIVVYFIPTVFLVFLLFS